MTATAAPHNTPDESLPETFRPEVAIVGLGYVGLPLAMTFADGGATVLGVDVDPSKPVLARNGTSWIEDIPSELVATHVEAGRFLATTDFSAIARADAVIIAVPTPLNRNREPDLTMVEAATRSIAPHLQPGQLVVLESTTWPGTTREILTPILEAADEATGRAARTVGVDFHLAYSPERVDPGNPKWNTKNTPKVVGGMTPACTEKAVALYERAVDTIHAVSAPETAELEKLFENIFRNVNIALVNELAMLCERMDIDVWEVINAAATKPFGFMKFLPGPGLGGHCIPIDPFYLSWKAREYDFSTEFIELAGKINSNMPYHCVRLVRQALDTHGKALRGARVLVLGVAYKRDIADYRESSAIKILELLQKAGADVVYHDPFVPEIEGGHGVTPPAAPANMSVELSDGELSRADAVMVLTDHSGIDWQRILEACALTVDFRNVYAGTPRSDTLWKL
ncbi:MAG: nucleotide sugar dehydrogenase [Thermoleophilia bacterium]|nr:nucleotide sugar dehydrogenase [Thermoleophilia bacterium]